MTRSPLKGLHLGRYKNHPAGRGGGADALLCLEGRGVNPNIRSCTSCTCIHGGRVGGNQGLFLNRRTPMRPQGNLAHKETHPPRTLQKACIQDRSFTYIKPPLRSRQFLGGPVWTAPPCQKHTKVTHLLPLSRPAGRNGLNASRSNRESQFLGKLSRSGTLRPLLASIPL